MKTNNEQSESRAARARILGAPRPESENNFADRNRADARALTDTAPGGVPPAPNPSPIRRETLAPFGAGVFLCENGYGKRAHSVLLRPALGTNYSRGGKRIRFRIGNFTVTQVE